MEEILPLMPFVIAPLLHPLTPLGQAEELYLATSVP